MSPFSWFLLLVVAAIFLFGFILIVARIARPHSKKMARGQAQLNKKRGATAPTAAGTAGISPVTPSTLGERASEWFMKYLWSILIVVALVGLVLWGLSGTLGTPSQSLQSPSLKTVWEGTKNYWLWIVLILAIMFFLSFFIAKPWAKALQWLSVITAFLLFAVFPVLVGIRGDETSNPQQAARSEIPLASSPQSSWPKWAIPPGGKSERIVSPPGFHLVAAGNHFLLHAVYPDGRECSFGQVCENASQIINYATNEAKETNIVPYAFAPN
jgi:hypothetical protein